MKLKQAIQILIEYGGRYSRGPGTGIPQAVTQTDRDLIAIAARRAFRYAHGREPYFTDLTNLGYSPDIFDNWPE